MADQIMGLLNEGWPAVRRQVIAASHVLLACDFDGTLSPIAERPEQASLPEETRNVLQALADLPRYTVAIVSGRALSDVKSKVQIPELYYAGNHGMEIEGPNTKHIDPVAARLRDTLKASIESLRLELADFDGAWVEDKGLTCSVHFRQVRAESQADLVDRVRDRLGPVVERDQIVLMVGKKVIDIRPALSWDKGKALAFLIETLQNDRRDASSHALPIYIGDDVTDEDAFRAVNQHRGLSVIVGSDDRPTEASYRIPSPVQTAEFLERLLLNERETS